MYIRMRTLELFNNYIYIYIYIYMGWVAQSV